jgi:mycothiol synthase
VSNDFDVDRDVPDVLALLRAATVADGVRPLSEEAELRLQHGGPPGGGDVVIRDGDDLAGYARFDIGSDGGVEAELVVHPAFRRRGHGSTLLDRLLELAGPRPLSLWAHGDLPGSAELLAPRGFSRARVLLQMRRDLAGIDPDPHPVLPDGIHVEPFRPGRDENAWLRVNARAFATHPEQGSWTAEDLRLREQEPWFDPEGFLLAWRGRPDDGGRLLGSHWTKTHPAGDVADEPVGEIYVLGIDPEAQGMSLGRALTDLGLAHLRSCGLGQVLLYVEEDNAPAVRLYESRGFRRSAVDVSWRRTPG